MKQILPQDAFTKFLWWIIDIFVVVAVVVMLFNWSHSFFTEESLKETAPFIEKEEGINNRFKAIESRLLKLEAAKELP